VENLLKRLYQAEYFTLLADECTDISTIEELSVVICWVENGLPVNHFIELVPLRKTDTSTIYETTDCMKKRGLVIGNMIGMGFDGAETFSGRHNGVQAQEFTLLNFCALPLPQAANNTQDVKNVYTTLTTLWKYFHYSLKWAECLKEIQRVLEILEFKIVKPSDTQW